MKKKILFLAFVFLTTLQGFSQATAYPVPDINHCNSDILDLTVQTPIVLGNQDTAVFTVTYYISEADAINNINPITNTAAFNSFGIVEIFIKVLNTLDNTFDITFFTLNSGPGVVVPELTDVKACNGYVLSALPTGKYYTGPGGTGFELVSGDMIVQTQTVYIYAENDMGCSDESDFFVEIVVPLTTQPEPLYVCSPNGSVNLTEIESQLMATQENILFEYYPTLLQAEEGYDAYTAAQLSNMSINDQLTIYVRINDYDTNCHWVIPIELIAIECNGNSISGFASLDFDDNCENFEAAASGIPVYLTHGNDVYITYTNPDGYYNFVNVPDGQNTVYINTPESASVSPSSHIITMPGNVSEQNFCISTNDEIVNDVAVTLIPITQARSGFPASYALVYQNIGNVMQSGSITLQFDANHLNFTSAMPVMAQSGNTLTLDYTDLMAFQTKVALVYFTVNVPQITPMNTILNFTVNITPLTGDINPANNTSVMSQIVVASWDPNDISVREGDKITEAQADDYLHYTVRFQNKGTANAENVRIVVDLDANLDWSTFEPLSGSDVFTVKRTEDEIEFMFTGIDLAFENTNTGTVPESNGHVIYRVKPKASVTIGDEMLAKANIYFDFNDPIETEEISTKVVALAGVNENSLDSFTVHPNPASANVNLIVANADNGFNVTVMDMLGKTVIKSSFSTNEASLDISALNSGIYFINIVADGKSQIKKLIVK